MKSKSLSFIVPLGVYPFDVLISFGQTDEQLKKVLAKYDAEWSDKMKVTGDGLFFINEKNQSMIRLKSIPVSDIEFGNLQHEIFHATTFILDRVGMKFKLLTSCEAYSYLAQFLTVEIYKKLPHYKK